MKRNGRRGRGEPLKIFKFEYRVSRGTRISIFHTKYLIGCRSAEVSAARKKRGKLGWWSHSKRKWIRYGVKGKRKARCSSLVLDSVSLAGIQRKSNDRLRDRFCQADNRLVAELIYTCTDRKSGIWFTAKIPTDKEVPLECVQPARNDKFIRLQWLCRYSSATTFLVPY